MWDDSGTEISDNLSSERLTRFGGVRLVLDVGSSYTDRYN